MHRLRSLPASLLRRSSLKNPSLLSAESGLLTSRTQLLLPVCNQSFNDITHRHSLSSNAAKSNSMNVFDRKMKLAQRTRAAQNPDYAFFHYLRDEVASRLVDRLADINKSFPVVLEIGCGSGAHVSKLLKPLAAPSSAALEALEQAAATPVDPTSNAKGKTNLSPASVKDRGIIKELHMTDSCAAALDRTREYWAQNAEAIPADRKQTFLVLDEENEEDWKRFPDHSVDMIISNLSMQWVNDLPGFLRRCKRMLKPDGVFLASMFGGSTLQELRSALTVADLERVGGVQAHVSPFVYGRDCGDLMAAAGFSMPTIDTDVLTVRYPDMFTLVDHLQKMGENNSVLQRAPSVSRDVFLAAASTYESLYADEEGLLPATFQIFYMIGWTPHASQPKPLERGTASIKLDQIGNMVDQEVNPNEGSKFEFRQEALAVKSTSNRPSMVFEWTKINFSSEGQTLH